MSASTLAATLLGLLLVGALPAEAQDAEGITESFEQAGFTLRADELEFEDGPNLYVASGHVRIETTDGRVLTADWVTFNASTMMGVAAGNVEMIDETDRLRARFAAVDLRSFTALLTDAVLDASTGFLVEARSLEKTGPTTYYANEALVTTCRCPDQDERRPFEFKAERTDIRVGGYAVARNVWARVLGVPVAYFPWLMLPIKTERQSGFLLPKIHNTNRSGFEIETPFFWAARPDLNVTLRPGWVSKRGFSGAVDVDYVFGERGYGQGSVAVLPHDDEVDRSDPDTRFSDDRWGYWLRHEQPLGPGSRLGLDLVQMSDNNYALDFGNLPGPVRRLRFSQSRAWASSTHGSLYANAEGISLDDLQNPNDLDRDDFVLHRLPDVRLAALLQPLGPLPLFGALDVRYTYFHQSDFTSGLFANVGDSAPASTVRGQFYDTGIDGLFNPHEPNASGAFLGADNHDDNFIMPSLTSTRTEGDGLYQEGELLADKGHRIDLYPRLVLPQRFGPVEALAEVGFRETLYFPKRGHTKTRELWTGRVDARTRLERPYELGGRTIRHVVEPSLGFGFISQQQQDDNTLFIPQGSVLQQRVRDGDLRVRLRNPTDRIADERFLLAALTNRVFASSEKAGEPVAQLAEIRLSSGYDFEEGRALDIFLQAELHPAERLSFDLVYGFDPKENRIAEALASFGWTGEAGHQVSVSYRYLREFTNVFENFIASDDVFNNASTTFTRIDQLTIGAQYMVSDRVEIFGNGFVSFEESSTKQGTLGVTFHSRCKCWDLVVSARQRTRPDQTEVLVEFRLAGIGLGLPGLDGS
ncbi:MAG: LPS assembly protein LptD [Myxococcota bacterium]